jgi:hypothetical protein
MMRQRRYALVVSDYRMTLPLDPRKS